MQQNFSQIYFNMKIAGFLIKFILLTYMYMYMQVAVLYK